MIGMWHILFVRNSSQSQYQKPLKYHVKMHHCQQKNTMDLYIGSKDSVKPIILMEPLLSYIYHPLRKGIIFSPATKIFKDLFFSDLNHGISPLISFLLRIIGNRNTVTRNKFLFTWNVNWDETQTVFLNSFRSLKEATRSQDLALLYTLFLSGL